jgi:hypothetical protein
MKTRISVLVLLAAIASTTAYTQTTDRKEKREEIKIENQKKREAIITAREFIFTAVTALPSGGPALNLTPGYYTVKFQPDLIDSYMPFFGTGYSGIGYGPDTGMKFKGKPEKFSVIKKAKIFQIEAAVKTDNDYFRISLQAGIEGNATLTITSDNRSTISFQGDISEFTGNR